MLLFNFNQGELSDIKILLPSSSLPLDTAHPSPYPRLVLNQMCLTQLKTAIIGFIMHPNLSDKVI